MILVDDILFIDLNDIDKMEKSLYRYESNNGRSVIVKNLNNIYNIFTANITYKHVDYIIKRPINYFRIITL